MRSSRVLTNFAVIALLASAMPAFAQSKDDLYNAAQAAYNSGKAVEANEGYCKVAAMDGNYKDAKALCESTKADAQTVINAHGKRYTDAVQAMQENRFDDAERLLKSIKYGPRVANVQTQLDRLAKLRAEAQNAAAAKAAGEAEVQQQARLQQGNDAFNRGDFAAARAALTGISGRFAGDAQNTLAKISQYEAKMAEAQRLVAEKKYGDAVVAFTDAIALNPNGPGDPRGQVRNAQQLMASGSAPPPVAPPKREEPKIDAESYIAQAKRFITRKDYSRARRFLNDVLVSDFRNKEAQDLLATLPKEERLPTGDEDPVLAKAVRDFYDGNFSDAEGRLQAYIFQNPKKPGLANFYLGAIQMMQFYLEGERDPNKKREAQRRFKEARGVEGFVPPEKFVSPKIMRAYSEAAAAAS